MKKYAFIDVLNTSTTAQKMLGFVVDWSKLCAYLKNERDCEEVYLYTGIENGDLETAKEFGNLANSGCVVKSKSIFAYKNRDKIIPVKCEKCENEKILTVDMGYTKKSNCDVELSVDAFEKSGPAVEFYVFTGDGDFEYLITKAIEKGVEKVYIVSYADKYKQAGITISRYSTKLRQLVAKNPTKVYYISLLDIKDKIKKNLKA